MAGIAVKNGLQKDLENWLAGEIALIDGVRLFTNDFFPTVDSINTDFVEPDWVGYGPQMPVWSSPIIWDGVDSMFTQSNFLQWIPGGFPGGPRTVFGYWAKTASALVFCERFAIPVVVSVVGLPFALQVTIKVRNC